MQTSAHRLGFAEAAREHLPMLRKWLAEPHVREWWGDPDREFDLIRAMVEGRDTTLPFIVEVDGEAVGFIQCWFIGHHQDDAWVDDDPWLSELPADAVGIDLFIGDAARLDRGVGTAALAAFTRRLLEAGNRTIIIDPDPDNLRAVRAYAKAGFRPIPDLAGRFPGVLILQFDPKANETR